jgi:hypothetical protein
VSAGGPAPLPLLDWKRRVLAMYADVRAGGGAPSAAARFRERRAELLRGHTESPVAAEARAAYDGPHWFAHDPSWRLEAELEPETDGPLLEIPSSTGEPVRFRRVGRLRPLTPAGRITLGAYWLQAYGGGLFLPVRDALGGTETYGGGRYLLDTVKGADLGPGGAEGGLILDMNYLVNPSCSYDPRWSCPLAPPGNRVDIPIPAGERAPAG